MARNYGASMVVVEVPQGSTATDLVIEFRSDGVAVDMSAATGSLFFNVRTLENVALVDDGAAAWLTDGSDGKLKVTLTAALVGTVRDLYVDGEVQGYNGGNLVARQFILRITPRAKVV